MNENDKLYRVVVKNGCHINTKTNSNGSKAAMQFTDDHNALAGPLEIIEVDRRELTNTDYDEYNKPLTLQDIIIRDVIVPAAREALYHAFIIGYEKLSFQLKTKALPELKQKSQNKTSALPLPLKLQVLLYLVLRMVWLEKNLKLYKS